MVENKNLIACPSCTHEFEVQEVGHPLFGRKVPADRLVAGAAVVGAREVVGMLLPAGFLFSVEPGHGLRIVADALRNRQLRTALRLGNETPAGQRS